LQYYVCFRDRRFVKNNVKAILATTDEKIISQKSRLVFINFAKYLVDFFRFPVIDGEYISKNVKIEGIKNLKEAQGLGKGIIAVTAHVGNWELAAVVTAQLGYQVNAIALSHKHRRVNELFIKQRQMKGVKVVPLGGALRKCFMALKNKELIGLLGDRDFTGGGIEVEFLGKMVKIPRGPAIFHLKVGAPLVPSFTIRQPDDSYRIIYEKPIQYNPTGNDEEDMINITKTFLKDVEDVIRRYPEQWFMFREFWDKAANRV
jgi:KDO2-lipid IV(A) lauroyltransferase